MRHVALQEEQADTLFNVTFSHSYMTSTLQAQQQQEHVLTSAATT